MCSTVLSGFLCVVSVGLATSVGGSIEGDISKAREEIIAAESAKQALETKIEKGRAMCKRGIAQLEHILKAEDEALEDDIKRLVANKSEENGGPALEKWLRRRIKLKQFDIRKLDFAMGLMMEDLRFYQERRRQQKPAECFKLERSLRELLVRADLLPSGEKESSNSSLYWELELKRLRMKLLQEYDRRQELEKELKDLEEECKIVEKNFIKEQEAWAENFRGVFDPTEKAMVDLKDQTEGVGEAFQELTQVLMTLEISKRTYEDVRKELKDFKKERDCYEKLFADVNS